MGSGARRARSDEAGSDRAGSSGAGRQARPAGGHPIVRVLSKLGVCSRMQAVDLVKAGRVRVNGRILRDPGAACRFTDEIAVDDRAVARTAKRTILLHKPRGVVTTRSDERGRATVYDLVSGAGTGAGPGAGEWLVPVGRLDRDSEGLLLLTNDTRLSAWLTDPANAVPRVYEVTVRPGMTPGEIAALTEGTDIGRDETSRPTSARLLATSPDASVVELTLTEGRNREVRRLFRARTRRVLKLVRTSFGPFRLGDLAPGEWREASASEGEAMRARVRAGR